MNTILDRIRKQINEVQQRNILPKALLLTPQTFKLVLADEKIKHLLKQGNHPAIAIRKTFHLEFEVSSSDVIIGKGVYPKKCPFCFNPLLMCHGKIYNLASAIQSLESVGIGRVLLACGHITEVSVKEYSIPLDYPRLDSEEKCTVCPQCGGKIKYLTETDAFCLDCDWDNLKPLF